MDVFDPNLLKTMQQAFELSKMFGADTRSETAGETGTEANTEQGSTDPENNMKRIIDMMNIIQALKNATAPQNSPPDASPGARAGMFADAMSANAGTTRKHAQPTGYTGAPPNFDSEIHTPALDSIKAAIPYLDIEYRRYMNIFVKLIEIRKMIDLYSQTTASMCSAAGSADSRYRSMLEAVKPLMDDDKANKIDLLLKLIEIRDITGRMKIHH